MSEQFKSIETTELVKIANAIRVKTGTTDKISLEDMPAKIAAIESCGDTDAEDGLITRTLTSYTNSRVTTIGSHALKQYSNLTAVSFPNVTKIYDGAFGTCTSLASANFPNATTIGSTAFWGCYKLTSISFPNVKTINAEAFRSCAGLTSVSFPNVTTIGYSAFYSCTQLTSVSFPNATTISGSTFLYCSSLTSVSFPNVKTIGHYAFAGCTGLTSVNFPNATTIHGHAFSNCTKLTSVSFPNVTTISYSAFNRCSRLTSASFPNVTTIDTNAFSYCTRLTKLYLTGSSLCKLTSVLAFYSTPIYGYSTSAGTYGSIYVPASLLTSYQTATNWAYFSSRFTAADGFYINSIKPMKALINTTYSLSTTIIVKDGDAMPTITISSDNNSMAGVSNVVITGNLISFDLTTYENEGEVTITMAASSGNDTQTSTFNVSVWKEIPKASYTVALIDNATYGFELNDNDYYESTNKGKNSSYAICKVNIAAPIDTTMYVDCINYAEAGYDYGILSNLNTALSSSAYADTSGIYYNFKNKSSSNVQTVTYDIPAGEHFIYIKFIKDSGGNSSNDSLQFKIRFE